MPKLLFITTRTMFRVVMSASNISAIHDEIASLSVGQSNKFRYRSRSGGYKTDRSVSGKGMTSSSHSCSSWQI